MNFLANLAMGAMMVMGSIFGLFHHIAPQASFGNYNPTGGGTYRLQSSIGTSDTSLTLSSFKEPVSNIAYTMSYLNSSIEYATIDPQTSVKEFISFTGITQNSDGTAVLTGVTRGLGFSYPYTASTTLQQPHSAQAILILSNPPQLTNQYANKNNTDTISAIWTFTALPTTTITCSIGSQLCNKTYVDSVARAGVSTSTETNGGQVRLGTLAEQANSYNGLPTDPAVVQTKNSTSTCQVVDSYNIIASSTTGKIDPGCIDSTTSSNYRIGSTTTTKLLSTYATTTTNLYTQGTLRINTVSASSSVLSIDTNGYVTANSLQNSVIAASGVEATTNSSATTTLASITLPANTLSTASSIRVTWQGYRTSASGNCIYYSQLGTGSASSTIGTTGLVSIGMQMIENVMATSTTAQFSNSTAYISTASTVNSSSIPSIVNYQTVSTYNTTGTLFLSLQVVAISGTCALSGYSVEKISN